MNLLFSAYNSWTHSIETSFFTWVDPSGRWRSSPTKDWPLASLSSTLPIALAYVAMVVLGPVVMRNRKPHQLFGLQFAYNMVQIAISAYMSIEAWLVCYRNGYSILPCEPFNDTLPPAANVIWLFTMTKVLDFMDTFFIVARKKDNQLSFLHVYHHLVMLMVCWMTLNVGYDGDAVITVLLNGGIHTIMYTYYFVSLHTNDIWWKKYLTMCQLIQFVGMMYQGVGLMVSQCQVFPVRVAWINTFFVSSLFVLFSDFYVRSYVVKSGKKNKTKQAHYKTKAVDNVVIAEAQPKQDTITPVSP